jgi:AcrR family transcriptional regulator
MMERAASKKSATAPGAEPAADVALLGPALQELVRSMLVEGATFEDVTEAVNERPGGGVTLGAIKHFFRSRLDVQQERVRRQLEVAEKLRQAAGNSTGAEKELVGALILSGLQAVNRRGAELSVKDVARNRMVNENLDLRNRMLRQQERESRRRQKVLEKRLEFETQRVELLRRKLGKVKKAVRPGQPGPHITDEAYRQILEIYGLLDEKPGPHGPSGGVV